MILFQGLDQRTLWNWWPAFARPWYDMPLASNTFICQWCRISLHCQSRWWNLWRSLRSNTWGYKNALDKILTNNVKMNAYSCRSSVLVASTVCAEIAPRLCTTWKSWRSLWGRTGDDECSNKLCLPTLNYNNLTLSFLQSCSHQIPNVKYHLMILLSKMKSLRVLHSYSSQRPAHITVLGLPYSAIKVAMICHKHSYLQS